MKKKITITASIIGVLLMGLFIIAGIEQYNKTKELREKGIRVEALVINKEVLKNKTHRGKSKGYSHSSKYAIDLAVFIDTTKANKHIKPKEEPQSIDDKIDALFEKTSFNINPSEYHKIRTYVDVSNFRNISANQWVIYVYLPNEIEKGRLLMELE